MKQQNTSTTSIHHSWTRERSGQELSAFISRRHEALSGASWGASDAELFAL